MNIMTTLRNRMLKDHTTKAFPCKTYKTEKAAEKATSDAALECAASFTKSGLEVKSAHYVVFYMPEWGRWVGAINQTEVLRRDNAVGGYLGVCPGFYKW